MIDQIESFNGTLSDNHLDSEFYFANRMQTSQSTPPIFEMNSDCNNIWTKEQINRLVKLALGYRKNWKKISIEMNDYRITPRIAKEKYNQIYEYNKINNNKFTQEEDLLLAKVYNMFGSKWTKITQLYFPFKTALVVKNRYYTFIKRYNRLQQLLNKGILFEQNNQISLEDTVCNWHSFMNHYDNGDFGSSSSDQLQDCQNIDQSLGEINGKELQQQDLVFYSQEHQKMMQICEEINILSDEIDSIFEILQNAL